MISLNLQSGRIGHNTNESDERQRCESAKVSAQDMPAVGGADCDC